MWLVSEGGLRVWLVGWLVLRWCVPSCVPSCLRCVFWAEIYGSQLNGKCYAADALLAMRNILPRRATLAFGFVCDRRLANII